MTLKTLGAAALLLAAAHVASAQPVALVLAPTAGGVLGTTFERAASGLFVDTFTFTPAAISGPVSVNLTSLSGPVNFYAALLNGEGFSFRPEDNAPSFSFQTTVSASQPLELTVLGFAGDATTLTPASGSYRGTVAAIPEPETYALMLAGLAALGAVARRRAAGTA